MGEIEAKKLAHFVGPKSPNIEVPDKTYVEIILDELAENETGALYTEIPSKRQVTNGELRAASISLGDAIFAQFDYQKGDVACICSYNIPEFVMALYGSTIAGLTVMLCNALYSYYEMNHQINDSNSKLLFIPGDKVFIQKAIKACEGTNVNRIVLLTEVDDQKYLDEVCVSNPQLKICKLVDFCGNKNAEIPKLIWDWKKDTAILPYSSGTTGTAKGVVMKHSSMRAYIKAFIIYNQIMAQYARPTYFTVPPMFHIYGFVVTAMMAPFSGGHALMQKRFNFTQMLECVAEYKASRLFLLPAIVVQMAKDPATKQYDLTYVKYILCGTAPLPKEQLKTLLESLNKDSPPLFSQAYGMTEAGGTSMPPDAPLEFVLSGSVGQVSMDGEAKVVDLETLQTVPVNTEGEIWLKSPTSMHSYLHRDKETADTLVGGGWVRTGDIGYFNEEGYLWITDRLKELVKYKGYQVPPAELEDLLLTHPAIVDAAVAGKPDEDAGELPTAFVVLGKDKTVSETEVMLYVKERVAPYKQLKGGVYFMENLPRNATGKLLRRKLMDLVSK